MFIANAYNCMYVDSERKTTMEGGGVLVALIVYRSKLGKRSTIIKSKYNLYEWMNGCTENNILFSSFLIFFWGTGVG